MRASVKGETSSPIIDKVSSVSDMIEHHIESRRSTFISYFIDDSK